MSTYNPYAFRSYIEETTVPTERIYVKNEKVTSRKILNWNKLTIAVLLVVIVVMSFFLISATASPVNGDIATEEETITYVGTGDTLWNIAKRHYSDANDIGFVVFLIMERNNMGNSTIQPGQQLILPLLS